jgi:hypothetical protein
MFSAVLHKPKREQQEPAAAERHEHVRGDKFVALLEPVEGREGPCLTHADRSVAGRCSCRRCGNGEWRDPPLTQITPSCNDTPECRATEPNGVRQIGMAVEPASEPDPQPAPNPGRGSAANLSKLLLKILADDQLIDDIIAGRIPRQHDRRLAEVLAQFRGSGQPGAFPPASPTAEETTTGPENDVAGRSEGCPGFPS